MVELQEPAVHGLGSRSRPRAWVARSPPPFLVFQLLFLQQLVTAPYQTLYGGQFKPSSIQIRAEMVSHHQPSDSDARDHLKIRQNRKPAS
jgi:hypothetical protein